MKNYETIKKLQKKKIVLLFILIILFSFSFRIPIYNKFPNNPDTYTMIKLSNDINNKNYIEWTKSPLSLTGFYPLSYQTGGIVYLSVISLLSNLTTPITILIWNYFFLIFLSIIFYQLSKMISDNKNVYIPLITTLIFLNARIIFRISNWSYSVRILYLLFYLSLIIFIFNKSSKRNIILTILVLFMIIIHKLFILIPLLFMSWMISKYIKPKKKWVIIFGLSTILIFILSFWIISISNLGYKDAAPITVNNFKLNQIIGVTFRYFMYVGIILVALPFSYVCLLKKQKLRQIDLFILLLFSLYSPFIKELTYTPYLVIPLIVLLMTYFFERIFTIKKIPVKKIVFLLIIISLIIPQVVTVDPDNSTSNSWKITAKKIALKNHILNQKYNKSFVCADESNLCNQIMALSKNNIVTIGSRSDITMANLINISSNKFSLNLRKIFDVNDSITQEKYWENKYKYTLVEYQNIHPSEIKKIVKLLRLEFIIFTKNENQEFNNEIVIKNKFGNTNQIYSSEEYQIHTK